MTETIAQIARGLSPATVHDLMRVDPERVEASCAGLLNLVLNDLVNVRKDNTVFLTPLGQQVRTYLEQNP